jgi:hypothetical protein
MKDKERMGERKRNKRKTPMGPLVTNPKPYK